MLLRALSLVSLFAIVVQENALAQCPDGSAPPCQSPSVRPAKPPPPYSVAVLYFDNLSGDTADIYLAVGFTEDVTAKLGQIPRLVVTSRAAMRRWRGRATPPINVLGRTLNVAHIVSGSVQRYGERVRVTVELVRAATGERVWGQQYDRSSTALLTIQEDIAQAVASGIAGQLLPTERATLARRPTHNLKAYDHYLRGNRLMWRSSLETNILAAIAEYRAALQLDSSFTSARGRLSSAYGLALNWALEVDGLPRDSLLALALATANRALSEDSMVADAWIGRSAALFQRGRREDFPALLESGRRAVVLNPGDDAAHQWYSSSLRRLGHFAESEQQLRLSILANPARVVALSDLALLLYVRHRHAEARGWIDSAITLDATLSYSYIVRARVRVELGDLSGALQDADTAVRVAAPKERPRALAVLAEMNARNGHVEHASRLLEAAFAEWNWRHGAPPAVVPVRNSYDAALAAIAIGDFDLGITIVERAHPRGAWLWSYLVFPAFDPVRSDPRFIRVFRESEPL